MDEMGHDQLTAASHSRVPLQEDFRRRDVRLVETNPRLWCPMKSSSVLLGQIFAN